VNHLKYSLLSDKGNVREMNEDYTKSLKVSENAHLFLLADGMGGHNKGEVASELAVESVVEYFQRHREIISNLHQKTDLPKIQEFIKRAIIFSNERVNKESLKEDQHGMGTTLVLSYLTKEFVVIANIGDSRAYLYCDNSFEQVTNDNSYVQELVKLGVISNEEARNHEKKNIVTRAIGTESGVEIDFYNFEIKEKDVLLMCSDGLTNMLKDFEIKEILDRKYLPSFCCEQLIKEAKQKGGYDNISIILVYL